MNGLETFPNFPIFFLGVYVKVTHSQRMGIGTWGWDNPCPKDGFGLHLRFLLGNLQNIHTNVACAAGKRPSVNKTLMMEPNCEKNILKFE